MLRKTTLAAAAIAFATVGSALFGGSALAAEAGDGGQAGPVSPQCGFSSAAITGPSLANGVNTGNTFLGNDQSQNIAGCDTDLEACSGGAAADLGTGSGRR
jgi:hypothetical protein